MLRERDPSTVAAGLGTCTRELCTLGGGQMGQAQGGSVATQAVGLVYGRHWHSWR